MNYKGINCDEDGEIDTHQDTWKILHNFNGNKMLRIENASLEDVGEYRCISGNLIRKIFILEISKFRIQFHRIKKHNKSFPYRCSHFRMASSESDITDTKSKSDTNERSSDYKLQRI